MPQPVSCLGVCVWLHCLLPRSTGSENDDRKSPAVYRHQGIDHDALMHEVKPWLRLSAPKGGMCRSLQDLLLPDDAAVDTDECC